MHNLVQEKLRALFRAKSVSWDGHMVKRKILPSYIQYDRVLGDDCVRRVSREWGLT